MTTRICLRLGVMAVSVMLSTVLALLEGAEPELAALADAS